MNLRKRLFLSNAALIVIPITITCVASFLFIYIFLAFSGRSFDYNNIKNLAEVKYNLAKAHKDIVSEDDYKFMDKKIQKAMYADSKKIGINMVLVLNDNVVINKKNFTKIDIENALHSFNEDSLNNEAVFNNSKYLVDIISLNLKNSETGYVILTVPEEEDGDILVIFIMFAVCVFIVSSIGVNGFLSLSMYKSLVKPLNQLKAAALKLSSGDLDCSVVEEGDEEIKELCKSFENMRLKLKEADFMQKRYDDNKKMIVSSVSHDIKTPITSIKGYIEGIRDGVASTPEKINQYLNIIYSKATHVDGLIEDLLFYSKLDINQIVFNFEKTNIVKFFEDCVTECEYDLLKANIKISILNELKNNNEVMIDRDKMRRVIINIIDNSRKYMNKAEGQISIILREAGKNIVIEMKDNGSGIDKENLPYIFDNFYRADESRSSSISGSGLGLAIAKEIVKGHNGQIWALSHKSDDENSSEGTSILISLKSDN